MNVANSGIKRPPETLAQKSRVWHSFLKETLSGSCQRNEVYEWHFLSKVNYTPLKIIPPLYEH